MFLLFCIEKNVRITTLKSNLKHQCSPPRVFFISEHDQQNASKNQTVCNGTW